MGVKIFISFSECRSQTLNLSMPSWCEKNKYYRAETVSFANVNYVQAHITKEADKPLSQQQQQQQ
jgi:hypothetical protein